MTNEAIIKKYEKIYKRENLRLLLKQVVDKMNALVTPDELRLLLPEADETTMETVKKAIEAKQVLCVDDVHISRPEEEKNERR